MTPAQPIRLVFLDLDSGLTPSQAAPLRGQWGWGTGSRGTRQPCKNRENWDRTSKTSQSLLTCLKREANSLFPWFLPEPSFPSVVCMCESEVAQSSPTLCNPMDCNPPGSTVHEILRARILEWVAISVSRGSS